MDRLTNDMTRLREEIDSSHKSRVQFVSGLRENVGEMSAGFREDNLRAAKETKAKLGAFVSDLRENVGEMSAGFREDNLRAAKETKAKLGAFVSGLRENVGEMRADFREDNLRAAKETKAKLGAFVSDLRENVGEMRADFREGHLRRAENNLRRAENNLRRAEKENAQLSEIRNDLIGARRAWAGSSPAKPKVKEETKPRSKGENEAAEPQTMEEISEETSEESIRDDLTLIQGIGKGMQNHLNAAGIYTFAQLAETTPDGLRRTLGKSARMAEVEKWIEQAQPGGKLA